MKKIIIIKSSGGELANQLWNYSSILAYAKEKNVPLQNWAFFEYASYFNLPKHSWLIEHIFFNRFKNDTTRKSAFKKRMWRKIYDIFSRSVMNLHKRSLVRVMDNDKTFYLPPTSNEHIKELERKGTLYLDGWIFRNSLGIAKHHKYISDYFAPKAHIKEKVDTFCNSLRIKHKTLIGVHIRQGDYKTWKGGRYYISPKEMSNVVREYLEQNNINKNDVCLVIASDGGVDETLFEGVQTTLTHMNMVEDLFVLSKCDVIIGSDSTFGDFAAYLGNIPHVIAKKDSVDWEYYKNKEGFFENKYCTWVHY